MKLTPVKTLCPDVEEIERLMFRVKSRSRKDVMHLVDMEKRHGLGSCDCERERFNASADCHHIREVRKYLAIRLVQAVILGNKNE